MNNTECNFTALDSKFNKSYLIATDYNKLIVNCSFDTNSDFYLPSQPDRETETAFKLIIYFLSAIANLLLLHVIYRDPLKRFRNPPSYFIANFTIADLVSIISGICDSIFYLHPEKTSQEIAGCFAAVGLQSSFLIIMLFAIDRYAAIAHPYKYQNFMRKKIVLVILILCPWCFSTIALPVIYFAPAFSSGKTLTKLFAGDVIALTAISLIVHPLTYWTFKRKIKELSSSSYTNKQMRKENLKIAKVLSTTVLVVSVCLITFMSPYVVAFSFILADCNQCLLSHTFVSFWQYYPLLTAIRLMTNSLVYAWRLPLYRESLKALIANTRLQHLLNRFNTRAENGTFRTTSIEIRQCDTKPSGLSRNSAFFEETKNTEDSTSTLSQLPGVHNEMGMVNVGMRNAVEETCFDEKL